MDQVGPISTSAGNAMAKISEMVEKIFPWKRFDNFQLLWGLSPQIKKILFLFKVAELLWWQRRSLHSHQLGGGRRRQLGNGSGRRLVSSCSRSLGCTYLYMAHNIYSDIFFGSFFLQQELLVPAPVC